MNPKLRALLDLGRVSNLPSVITNVIAAWLLAGGSFGFGLIMVALGSMLLYLAGTTLNDAVDVKFDREHRPERPIPAGIFSAASVWGIGLAYMVAGAAILIFFTSAWPVWVVLLVAAILLYDIVHKKSSGAVFVMGACRFFLYLTAASAAVDGFGLLFGVIMWASALFLYIVGLTLIARGESSGGGVPQVAIGFLAAPVIAAGVALITGGGSIEFGVCLLALLLWIGICLRRLKGDDPARIGRFVGGLLAGIPLIDALAVSAISPLTGLLLLLALPLSMLLQRLVAAT